MNISEQTIKLLVMIIIIIFFLGISLGLLARNIIETIINIIIIIINKYRKDKNK